MSRAASPSPPTRSGVRRGSIGARRLNMGLGAAETGGSDAHIVDAVGRAFTEFPGKTPAALRKAIELGETSAGRRRYRAVGLVRYAAWGLNHQRYVVAV